MAAEAHALPRRDLTSGGLHGSIWHLAVPMILEMVVLNIAMALDTYWVGQLGEAAVAVVNAIVALSVHPPAGGWNTLRWQFIAGILLAALGGCLVTLYKPGPAPAKPKMAVEQVVSDEPK